MKQINMNYRKIEHNGSNTDKKLELLLTKIAKWHNITPKLWIKDYKVSTEDIEETIEKIKNTENDDLFLTIAEDNKGQAQGFIWAYKQEESKDSVMILSLYTTEDYRGKGIATNLKLQLEKWCRLKDIKAIQTTVHYTNHNMIALNEKLGYTSGMVCMTKTL